MMHPFKTSGNYESSPAFTQENFIYACE